jgi:hypothetical protein
MIYPEQITSDSFNIGANLNIVNRNRSYSTPVSLIGLQIIEKRSISVFSGIFFDFSPENQRIG